jgi:hypothetical protein
VEIYDSARKHGVTDADIEHAISHALVTAEDEEGKVLYLGPDRTGNLHEIVTVQREGGDESYGRTKSGVELTPDALDRMSKEAEAGLDVGTLRRRPGRPSMGSGPADALPVRLDPELRRAVDERAAAEHTTSSEVVREALRRYLRTG